MEIYWQKLRGMGLLLTSLLVALALGMAMGGVFGASVAPQPLAAQATCDRYVLGVDAGDHGDCSDMEHPCRTVQYAVRQAAPGDRICVASHSLAGPLTYTGTVEITQSLTLDGAWEAMCVDPSNLTCSFTAIPCNPANVTLDAQGAGRVISISGGIGGNGVITPVIDCFTITGGDGTGFGGVPEPGEHYEHDSGGGIFSRDAAPIIMNNVITGNFGGKSTPTYGHGGGVCLMNAPATALIYNNLIAYNIGDGSTTGAAGGVLLWDSDVKVLSNTIRDNRAANSAGRGGGIAVMGGRPSLDSNTIISNAGSSWIMAQGGGIYVDSRGPVTIERNHIYGNRALINAGGTPWTAQGGGIYAGGESGGVLIMKDNQINDNVAAPLNPHQGMGGGVYVYNLHIPSEIRGNVIHDNIAGFNDSGAGGGMYLKDSVTLVEDNAIYNNVATWSGNLGTGGGLHIDGGQMRLSRNTIAENYAVYFMWPPNTDTVGFGGGVYVTHTTAFSSSGNTIAMNQAATDGGGMYLTSLPHASLWNDQFSQNYAGVNGGAVFVVTASATFVGPTLYSNAAESGGGLYLQNGNNVTLSDAQFIENEAEGSGGGMFIFSGTSLTLTHNHWISNSATAYGGGLFAQTTNALMIAHNYFFGNRADDGGAGASCLFDTGLRLEANTFSSNVGTGVGLVLSDAWLDNNIVTRHPLGVSAAGGMTRMRHNTVVGNHTGIQISGWWMADGTAVLTNTLVAGHTTGITVTAGDTATLTATLWGRGPWSNTQDWGGAGTIVSTLDVYGDPDFADPAVDDYHLLGTSPAINAGVEASLDHDMDGDLRPMGAAPDIGADEFVRHCFLPLVLRQF